jgi:hypothetical protein
MALSILSSVVWCNNRALLLAIAVLSACPLSKSKGPLVAIKGGSGFASIVGKTIIFCCILIEMKAFAFAG